MKSDSEGLRDEPVLGRSNRGPSGSACRRRGRDASSGRRPPVWNTGARAWPSASRSSAAAGRPSSAPGTRASSVLCWPPA